MTSAIISTKQVPEHYREARRQHELGNIDAAEDGYLKALCMTPEDPLLLFFMGTVFMQRKAYGLAIPIFTRCVEMAKKFAEAYNNLGLCLKNCGHMDMARQAFELSLKCDQKNPDVHNNLATLHINTGTPEIAMAHCKTALEIDPKHVQATWNLALAHLELGNYAAGWPLYKSGYRAQGRNLRQYDCAPWDGTHTKRLVIYGEQGVGDEILFGSMIVDAARLCDELIIDSHPRLAPMFKRAFPKAEVYGTRKGVANWLWDKMPVTAKASVADLAGMFRMQPEDFPGEAYITTDPKLDRKAANYLAALPGAGPRIGISWKGGTPDTNINDRSIIPDKLVAMLQALSGVTWVSLQYDKDAPAIVNYMKDRHGIRLHHPQAMIDDFDQLTSLAGQCDLVVTVDQTLVWQMGAIGKECWVLTPHKVSWRYPTRFGDRTPWFRSLRLFRQGADCKWEPVIERVSNELRQLCDEHNQRRVSAAQ